MSQLQSFADQRRLPASTFCQRLTALALLALAFALATSPARAQDDGAVGIAPVMMDFGNGTRVQTEYRSGTRTSPLTALRPSKTSSRCRPSRTATRPSFGPAPTTIRTFASASRSCRSTTARRCDA
jgi:hypothetical protein